MRKIVFFVLGVFVLISCKSKKSTTHDAHSKSDFEKVNTFKKFKKIQDNIKQDFTSVVLESDVDYTGPGMKQKVHAEIRLLRDQKIHITVRYFGIIMAKAILTPEEVSCYEKLGSTYYQGDYSSISEWMGIPLDFFKIQNIILGNTIEKISEENYSFEQLTDKIRMTQKESMAINHIFEFNLSDMLLKEQQFVQSVWKREMIVSYDDREYIMDSVTVLLPKKIKIVATQDTQAYQICLQHNSIELNKEISYAFKVPDGYKKIDLK